MQFFLTVYSPENPEKKNASWFAIPPKGYFCPFLSPGHYIYKIA